MPGPDSSYDEWAPARDADDEGHHGPVVRDKRRIDPETGQIREPAAMSAAPESDGAELSGSGDAETPPEPDTAELASDSQLAMERLEDLQRLQAEYVNYRKRVERDRTVARDTAVAGVLESLLPVLDDIHLARQHGDLDGGPFAAIADKLETVLGRYGLESFGAVGEPFDPAVHEALMHTEADLGEGVDVTTVTQVLQPGYRAGERVLRAARVAVADPG
jgi:molecular chaperone GrpE